MENYSASELELIERYFEMLRWTRKSGRVSESIRKRQLEYFLKYDKHIVLKAIKIHLEKYPDRREEYTRGIIRNVAREAENGQHQLGSEGGGAQETAEGLAQRNRAAADAIAARLGEI